MTTTFCAGILGQTAAFRNVLNSQVTNLLVQKGNQQQKCTYGVTSKIRLRTRGNVGFGPSTIDRLLSLLRHPCTLNEAQLFGRVTPGPFPDAMKLPSVKNFQ